MVSGKSNHLVNASTHFVETCVFHVDCVGPEGVGSPLVQDQGRETIQSAPQGHMLESLETVLYRADLCIHLERERSGEEGEEGERGRGRGRRRRARELSVKNPFIHPSTTSPSPSPSSPPSLPPLHSPFPGWMDRWVDGWTDEQTNRWTENGQWMYINERHTNQTSSHKSPWPKALVGGPHIALIPHTPVSQQVPTGQRCTHQGEMP